jgi:uncharacterized glyoxalase superfamily protein PhnB
MARITPEIAVSDIEKSLQFYEMIGFVKDNTGIVDDKGSQWYSLALGDAALWLIRQDIVEDMQHGETVGNGVNIYIQVDDVDALYEKLAKSGLDMNVLKEIETLWYGLRQFTIADPDGYTLTINMPVAQEVAGQPDAQS